MAVLKIYSLEDAQERDVVSTLPEGEYIIGRGGLLNCHDKRISRKHAVINVHKDIASIKAVHVNPCFFKEAKGNSITILPKDTSIMLNDGDQFSFLSDLFWFRVRLIVDSNNDTLLQNTSHAAELPDNGVNSTTEAEKTTVSTAEDDDNVPSTSKRSYEEDSAETCKRKKSENGVLLAASPNEDKDYISVDAKSIAESKIDSGRLIGNLLSILEEDYGSKSEADGKQGMVVEESTSSEVACSSNNNMVEIKEKDNEMEGVLNGEDRKEGVESLGNNQVQIKQEKTDDNTRCGDMSVPNNSNSVKIKEEIPEENNETTEIAGCSIKLATDTVKKENKDDSQTEEEAGKDKGQNGASCSKDNEKKRRREQCWYGPSCYRKNPIHRADFSHPGDNDYDSDPDDDRPECPFGTVCYRRNLDHRRLYKHSNPPAAKPNDGGDGKPKRKRKSPKKKAQSNDDNSEDQSDDDDGTPKKRVTRTPKNKVNYDSEDDYDLNDPFIDDASSDEFVLSGDEDDDSTDWEDSQAVSEESQETRRLLKEAKRFAKANKNK